MFNQVYQAKANFLKAKQLQGFDVSKQWDALQTAATELFEHNFGNLKQAAGTLQERYKSRLIDSYRKDEKLDFVNDFHGHIIPEQPEVTKINPKELLTTASDILSTGELETFELFLQGWSGKEIAEMLKKSGAAVSKRLGHIIDKLKVDEFIIELTEVAL